MSDELERLRRRIDDLETTLAFQDRTIAQLNQVLTEFVGRVERSEQRLATLEQAPPTLPDDDEA